MIASTDTLNRMLDMAIREWEGMPELAAEWGEWDPGSRTDFALDWPVSEGRLTSLAAAANAGKLDRDQQARYDHLRDLVRANRAILAKLLEE